MEEMTCFTTTQAAEILNVHARTIRKWIDTFYEYILPDINEKGHYTLKKESLERLKDIKTRLQNTQKSMRQIKEDLLNEGKINLNNFIEENNKDNNTVILQKEKIEELKASIEKIERKLQNFFDVIRFIEHKINCLEDNFLTIEDLYQQLLVKIYKNQEDIKALLKNYFSSSMYTAVTYNQKQNKDFLQSKISLKRKRKKKILGIF